VEIQERLYQMAVRSIRYNGLENRIQMIRGDVKEIAKTAGYGKFDVVTCNPPYFRSLSPHVLNENEYLAIARHEILCTLEDVVRASSQLLRQGGKAAFVHRPERLMDLLMLMRQYRLEPKRLRFVYPKIGKEANTILVEGTKDGNPGLKTLPPLIVYGDDNQYTQEVREMLYGQS
jgi:tRNA1(Val) A37 N6-methylase TrmN6